MKNIVLAKTSHDFLKECFENNDKSDALEFLEDERDMVEDLLKDLKDFIDNNCTLNEKKVFILQTLCIMRCLRNLIEHDNIIELYHQLGFIEDIMSGLNEELMVR